MTDHVLVISIGPVQDFIAQARRSRDLWMGSHLLSELSRAAAKGAAEAGADLVFPAMRKGAPELEPSDGFYRLDSQPVVSVANKILARVRSNPSDIARRARSAAMQRLTEIADEVRKRCAVELIEDRPAWDEQIETLIEFLAAWAPISGASGYAEARRLAESLLSSRKNLRDFRQWTRQRGNAPKSSLDGARETVLRERPPGKRTQSKLRLSDGESLDAVGVIKRAGGEPQQFIPLSNVAMAAWMDAAQTHAPGEWKSLNQACDALDLLSRVNRPDTRVGKLFRFDAELFLRDRWPALFEDEGRTRDEGRSWGVKNAGPLLEKMNSPSPYVACLIADGDRMGQSIDGLVDDEAQRRFSRQLSSFAPEVRRIVEQKHRGVLLYCGGDDILAFLTIVDAIKCADELRLAFQEQIGEAGRGATMSAGIGICHLLDGMAHLREVAREAEQLAKGDSLPLQDQRDSLAIVLDKRSGGRCSWRCSWSAAKKAIALAVDVLARHELPGGKVYEVRRDLMRFPHPDAIQDSSADWARALRADVTRTLARANEGKGLTPDMVGLVFAASDDYAKTHQEVRKWVDRLLIARAIAEATPRRR